MQLDRPWAPWYPYNRAMMPRPTAPAYGSAQWMWRGRFPQFPRYNRPNGPWYDDNEWVPTPAPPTGKR